jgi:hypothetical protein
MPTTVKTAIRALQDPALRAAAVKRVNAYIPATFDFAELAASQAGWQNLQGLYTELQDDFQQAEKRLKASLTPLHHREAVRAAFAMIDGILYGVKASIVSRIAALPPDLFSQAEVDCLRETTTITANGKSKAIPTFPKLRENVIIAFNAYLKNAASPMIFRPARKPWNDFCDAIKIRDRITHPKSPASIAITPQELKTVHDATYWFGLTFGSILNETNKATGATLISVLPRYEMERDRLAAASTADPTNTQLRNQHASFATLCTDMAAAIAVVATLP